MKHGWKKHTTKDRNEVWWDFLANVMLMTKVCVNIFQIKQVMAKNILVLIHGDISCVKWYQRPNDKSCNLTSKTTFKMIVYVDR